MKKKFAFLLILWGLSFLPAQAAKIPAEAKKHLNYGTAALEMATDTGGYQKAADEFEEAAKLAPRWPAPYFNLGVIYSKMERYDDALRNYKKYLELSPRAKDAEKVKSEIDKLEYKKEQQSDKKSFCGTWCGVFNPSADACDFNLEFSQSPADKTRYNLFTWCANSDDCGEDTGWAITATYFTIGADNKFDAMGVVEKLEGANKTVTGTGRITGFLIDKANSGEGKDLINLSFQFKGEWYSIKFKRVINGHSE